MEMTFDVKHVMVKYNALSNSPNTLQIHGSSNITRARKFSQAWHSFLFTNLISKQKIIIIINVIPMFCVPTFRVPVFPILVHARFPRLPGGKSFLALDTGSIVSRARA